MEKAVRRAGRSVSMIHSITSNFGKESGLPFRTTAHTTCSDESDI